LPPPNDDRVAALREEVRSATKGLGLEAKDVVQAGRGGRKRGVNGNALLRLTLVEKDGVLGWVAGDAGSRGTRRKRGRLRRGPAAADGAVEVHSVDFERIAPSEITAHLNRLDERLTPALGLRQWRDGRLVPVARPAAREGQRVLLILHGTFSKGEAITDQLAGAPGGAELFRTLSRQYAEILTFDHPTLAVSPMLNAYDLERAVGACPATFDVIAHSRGGLVARAWADGFRGGRRGFERLVLVGSPLAGTSLAAPPRMREAMKFLTNVGGALRGAFAAGSANPFLALGAGIMQVIVSVTSAAAYTPLLDAAVAMVPGLAAQSRVGNAPELLRLRDSNAIPPAAFFAVQANFEPQAVGWNFLKLFVKPRQRLADWGADLLFPGANDLVVDHDSIVSLSNQTRIPSGNILDFGTQDTVHHCNYFAQARTVRFLGDALIRK
jgi:hypothetical protein